MLMQAMFSRCGESIPMRVNRFDYVFKANEHGDMVCDVNSEEHIKILKHMGTFHEYEKPVKKTITRRQKSACIINDVKEVEICTQKGF